MTAHEWRLERDGEHFALVQRNGDAVDRYPLPDANVLTLAGDSILDPGCAPGDADCFQNIGGASGGWALTGNAGTDASTDFIGTTDGQDFVVKANNTEIARFGQNNNIAMGLTTTASGNVSTAFGDTTLARSYAETALGLHSTDYSPIDTTAFSLLDRLITVGNGSGSGTEHNALTIWKDGSFAFNDDNFQNDNPGTEQNMFYFNFGNHDGLGAAQTKRAIRLGSVVNGEWDINDANVGDKSIALGFGGMIASGTSSIAWGGSNNVASGDYSTAFGSAGSLASGFASTSWGYTAHAAGPLATTWGSHTLASGIQSTAWGADSTASAEASTAYGSNTTASSFAETAIGYFNTIYTPVNTSGSDVADRVFVVGNGSGGGSRSDAFTVLKSGKIGVGIDNFEDPLNQIDDGAALLQVDGDIYATGVLTENLTISSDRRLKTNINDLTYGLDAVRNLRPVAYDLIADGSHQFGFIAQEVQTQFPNLINEGKFLSLNYIGIIPLLTKAIQELDLKVTDIEKLETLAGQNSFVQNLIAWFASASNGITRIFTDRLDTKQLCVEDVCVDRAQFLRMVEESSQVTGGQSPNPEPTPTPTTGDTTEGNSGDTAPTDTNSGNSDSPAPEQPADPAPETPAL